MMGPRPPAGSRIGRRLGIVVALIAATTIVIATANGSTTQGDTTALISKIGLGSDTAKQIVSVWEDEDTLEAISHAPGYYNDHRWVSDLEQGDLKPLTEKHLTHLIGDAEGDLKRARSIRDQLNMLGSQIAAQTVPPGLTDGLSNGSRQFIGDWNGYLGDAAKTVNNFRELTGRILVFIAAFGTLAEQAKVIKSGGSHAEYMTVLRRVQLDLRRIHKLQLAAGRPLAYSRHMIAIMNLTQSDRDAHAIYQRVATRYPSGVMLTSGYLFTPHAINT